MALDPLTAAFELGKTAIDKIFPDPNKRAEQMLNLERLKQDGRLAELQAEVQLLLGQLKVNEAEAKHKSLFVSGWRPAVGWVCVFVLAFNYIGVYILEYIATLSGGTAEVPQRFDMSDLWPVLLGMLGIGGMRSFDKSKGTQTDSLRR